MQIDLIESSQDTRKQMCLLTLILFTAHLKQHSDPAVTEILKHNMNLLLGYCLLQQMFCIPTAMKSTLLLLKLPSRL